MNLVQAAVGAMFRKRYADADLRHRRLERESAPQTLVFVEKMQLNRKTPELLSFGIAAHLPRKAARGFGIAVRLNDVKTQRQLPCLAVLTVFR